MTHYDPKIIHMAPGPDGAFREQGYDQPTYQTPPTPPGAIYHTPTWQQPPHTTVLMYAAEGTYDSPPPRSLPPTQPGGRAERPHSSRNIVLGAVAVSAVLIAGVLIGRTSGQPAERQAGSQNQQPVPVATATVTQSEVVIQQVTGPTTTESVTATATDTQTVETTATVTQTETAIATDTKTVEKTVTATATVTRTEHDNNDNGDSNQPPR